MTNEPETPTQPRRRQRQAIPWRCVGLDEQQIVPLRLDNGDLHPDTLDEIALEDIQTLATNNFCVHVDRVPRCALACEENFTPIFQPVISTDLCIYERLELEKWIAAKNEETQMPRFRSTVTGENFLPNLQYWVRFSSSGTLTSKLDPRREFDREHPILVVFEKKEKSLLAIEKMDDHGCGQLTIYSFHKKHLQNGSEGVYIEEQSFRNLDYAMLDQWLILSEYAVSLEEIQTRTVGSTAQAVAHLERQIANDKTALAVVQPQPQTYFSNRYLSGLLALLFFRRSQQADWLSAYLAVLMQTHILSQTRFDSGYERLQPASGFGRLFLRTPHSERRALPAPDRRIPIGATTESPSNF